MENQTQTLFFAPLKLPEIPLDGPRSAELTRSVTC